MLCALSVLPAKAASGAEFVNNTTFYYNDVEGGVEIINTPWNMPEYSGAIDIPAELGGKKVVAIGYRAFESSSITSVTIPSGVTRFGDYAFASCYSLNTMTIRSAVIPTIGDWCFDGTTLPQITINTYPRYAETFKTLGFNKIQTDITYDGSVEVVTEIENAAPLHMTYYYYEFADGVEITYNTYEGKGYESYPGNLYIPSEINGKPVIGISDYAFSGCTRSTVITIPAGVRVIREKAFEYCEISTVDCYTGGVPETASTAFDNTPLTDTPNKCQLYVHKDYFDQFKNDPLWGKFGYIYSRIRDYDFKTTIDGITYYYNSIDGGLEIIGMIVGEDISAVSIPSTIGAVPVVSIKGGYFSGGLLFQSDVEAKQITKLTIPQTVTNVAGDVFSGCTNIEYLNLDMPTVQDGFRNLTGLKTLKIGEHTQTIASDAFSGCSNIETLTLDIATVGDCFAGLSNLKTIVLRDPVTTVNDDAFTGCTGVTDLTIGKSLVNESDVVFAPLKNSIVNLTANCKNIYKWFTGSTSLLSVSLGKNVQTIGNDAFNNCQKLATTNFSEGLVSVGNKAFYYCRGLQAALLPSTVNSIGESAFRYCDNMKQVNIPEGVTLIQNLTFNNCGITSLTIPSTVTDITLHAFSSCVNLEEIIIPATVKNIGDFVFANCKSVKHISIPDSNLKFQVDDDNVFSGCTGLETVDIDKREVKGWFKGNTSLKTVNFGIHVLKIDKEAFYGCTGLTSVYIPRFVKEIGTAAFGGCTGITSFDVDKENIYYCSQDGLLFKDGHILVSYPLGKEDVVLQDFVDLIDAGAFQGSTYSTIILPERVLGIKAGAFKDCANLKTVKCYRSPLSEVPDRTTEITVVEVGAFEGCDLSKATLWVHEWALDDYKAFEEWKKFGNIVDMNCVTPVISYVDGTLNFASETPGVIYHYTIEDKDIVTDQIVDNGKVYLDGCYEVSVYASAEGFDNSDVAKACLFFLPNPQGDDITTDVIEVPEMRGILAYSNNGFITITGLNNLEYVSFYDLNGTKLGAVSAYNGVATFKAAVGSVVIATFTNSSIKILVR